MPILVANDLRKSYGPDAVLDGVSVSIHSGERVGLVGLNGAGKSTLARILAGLETADAGSVARRRDATVEYLAQAPSFEGRPSAREAVVAGLRAWSDAKARYDAASVAIGSASEASAERLVGDQAAAAADVERLGGWQVDHEVDSLLGHLHIARPDDPVETMSGGERRRVALARLLIARPTLAVLDEPTNHLDVETVEWLETYLLETYQGALLLITHDRYLLDRVVDRTVEVDRGKAYVYDGGYGDYLAAKAERAAHTARTESNRQNFLRTELEWLRRQPKARSTKQKARIDRAETAIEAPKPRADRAATFSLEEVRAGKTVIELDGASFDVGGRRLIDRLTWVLGAGERVGVVGRNGAGKTTLLKGLTGQLAPSAGAVTRGVNTRIAYFDQERVGLDDRASVFENVVGDQPKVIVGGVAIEPRSYLERFAFEPAKQRQPVGSLSGGERARVALAKLLRQPANVILLDEPTNDLDLATLGSLEQMLVEIDATAIIVTHDRYFLDRVATSVLAFEGDGRVVLYPGNYTMYRALRDANRAEAEAAARDRAAAARPASEPRAPQAATPSPAARSPANPKPLNYAENVELEGLPDLVDAAEAEVARLQSALAAPESYGQGSGAVRELLERVDVAKAEASRLTERWEQLEARRALGPKRR